ncbi:HEAT repeat domain-containing protein [Rhodohalobacter halophilus]|uniref:HEAT repeat domain-containing protein n=1 Tax=Rhodohalobacter halophilus TaxID=1812810 RepID=UPI00159F1852|nr:HEAT repeat domain-containing protein [Rhodohalobacter halophilus]
MRKQFFLLCSALLFNLGIYSAVQSQNWDYESYPYQPFEISHLDAEITISETGVIEGDLLYLLTLKDNRSDSLVFDAREIEILSLVLEGESADFYIESDKLIIPVADSFTQGEELSLRVQYRVSPMFGLNQTAKGTFFSSLLPKTTSHWLPVVDHPRVQFTTEMIFTHPSGKTLISNGRQSSRDIESVSEEVTIYSSNKPISPVDLTFALGDVELVASTQSSRGSGSASRLFERRSDNHIYIYSENSAINTDDILHTAVDAYEKLYNSLGIGYPFRDLSIIILDDDYWETKSYGAGVIYLYESRGDLKEQLYRSMTGLWVGSHIRAEQWQDANAVLAMQAYVNSDLFDLDYITEETPVPYHVFDGSMESVWRYGLEQDSFSTFAGRFERVMNTLLNETGGVVTWNDLAGSIYRDSGVPYFEKLELPEVREEEPVEYLYEAELTHNEQDQNMTIHFRAIGEPLNELVTVQVDEITFQDQKQSEITFTGSDDTIVLNTSAATENIRFTVLGRDDITLETKKPFEFWIYQLRNGEEIRDRKEAARSLARYSDNPDLQLAIRDQMRGEENQDVYAELLRTLSAVTMGATGTDETFISHLSSNYSAEVQLAAVEALAHFSENDRVVSRLRSVANQTENGELRTAAIRSLNETTNPDRFKVLAEDLITRESALYDVPLILRLLAEKGEEEAAVRYASTFLAEGFPFTVRQEILQLVLNLDQSREGWENRLPSLLQDRDPRIRVRSLEALNRTGSSFQSEWIERREADEYDERVRRSLNSL